MGRTRHPKESLKEGGYKGIFPGFGSLSIGSGQAVPERVGVGGGHLLIRAIALRRLRTVFSRFGTDGRSNFEKKGSGKNRGFGKEKSS